MYPTIVLIFFLLGHVNCVYVLFDYNASDFTDHKMPDVINVTFRSENQSQIQIYLKLAPDFNLDIPLYTLNTDQHGQMFGKKVKSDIAKNISFYQDVENMAVFQVYKSEEQLESNQLNLKGEFHMNNSKYYFNSEDKYTNKSETNDSPLLHAAPRTNTYGDIYYLELQNESYVDISDVKVPPPQNIKPMKYTIPNIANEFSITEDQLNLTAANWSAPLDRHKRDALTDYSIDVAAIVDYEVYRRFLTEADLRYNEALSNIREHYAFVFTGIDMLYQDISDNFRIRIRLCTVYVAATRSASSFIDEHVNQNSLNVEDALFDLRRFIAGNGRNIVGQYDHVMLFTGYDLYSSISHNAVDYAYIGTMCRNDGYSSSVIEGRKSLSLINTAAHELGHSLSAEHDGTKNLCRFEDRYIMAASNSAEDIYTMYHPWQFSSCSIKYFSDFLKRTADTSRGYTCLGFFLDVNSDIPDVTGRLMGQEVTPDQQCQQMYGSESYYCRKLNEDICHSMYCKDPNKDNWCFQQSALPGTSCGDGKICINGMCLDDPYAPQVNEGCIFGDKPGYVYQSMTCSQFVASHTGYCYNDIIYQLCYSSCDKVYKPIQVPWSTKPPTVKSTKISTTLLHVDTTKSSSGTSLTECRPGDPDIMPDLCTAPS
ncbi:A disintegrin and metalloproteinase with thrombospondin motifs 7, partial [Bulinus truncatus]